MSKILGFILLILISSLIIGNLGYYFLPLDILNYFPSFSFEIWTPPHNSLLADPIFQFEPWRIYSASFFSNLQLPYWNSSNAGGVPFIANMQSAFFFPLNILYYICGPSSLLGISLIKIAFFLISTYFYLRNLRFGKATSLIGAFVSTSSYMILWIHWPQTNVFMFFPLVILLSEKVKKSISFRKYFIFLSIVYFLMILGGHPETLFNILFVHFLYLIVRKISLKITAITILSIFVSVLLAAFQIFPFIEYLFNSYAFMERSINHISQLPTFTLPYLLLPQISGSPAYSLYKSLSNSTNFAEYAAGGIGLIVSTAIIMACFKKAKSEFVKFPIIMILLLLFLAYFSGGISSLFNIPILGLNNHQRFIAFIPFFASITFAYSLDKIKINSFLSKSLLVVAFVLLLISVILKGNDTRESQYIIYAIKYLSFTLFTTYFFFYFVSSKFKFKYVLASIILIVQIFLPNAVYNNFVNKKLYYPNNDFIKVLEQNQKLRILQVGNLSMPPDINIAYGLESAENYDALDVKNYKLAFDKSFPFKNHLGLVDEVSYSNLKYFGIGIVISDYDLNSRKVPVQKEADVRIPLTHGISLPFKGINGELSGVRFITQNFNRYNNCLINIELIDESLKTLIGSSTINCSDVRDGMFYTASFNYVKIISNKKYQLKITPLEVSKNNYIAFLGDSRGNPYAEVLIKNKEENYIKLFSEKSVNIFKVKDSKKIISNISYKVLNQSPTNISLATNSIKSGYINLKYTYYPGWIAKIDGKKAQINGRHPFMSINIPSGNHLIEIKYQPNIYIFSIVASFLAFTFFFIFTARDLIKNQHVIAKYEKYIKNSKVHLSKKELKRTLKHLICGFTFGLLISILLISFLPDKIYLSYVTSVNWLTVNNHSITLDYLKMLIVAVCMFVSITASWINLTLKK